MLDNLRLRLEKKITETSIRKIKEFHRRHFVRKIHGDKYRKKTGNEPIPPNNKAPRYWKIDRQFNPFSVRKDASVYAHQIASKIKNLEYEPLPSLITTIPKRNGDSREITIYSVPDASVSKLLFEELYERNFHYFSENSYAYRWEKNAHHAVRYIANDLNPYERRFVLEYDFKSYFDSINHEYLLERLKQKFEVSKHEMDVIKSILTGRRAGSVQEYEQGTFVTNNSEGVPQGNSISLFLANVACNELDHSIRKTGAVFARYGDDLLILCDEYSQATECANLVSKYSLKAGTEVNYKKSKGIRLLTPEDLENTEMKSVSSFEYLGYKVTIPESENISERTNISVRDSNVKRIKSKVSSIIHRHLIYYIDGGQIYDRRYDSELGIDWDMVTCINDLRGYMYGGLSEREMRQSLEDRSRKLKKVFCAVSYFPLVNDPEVFKSLNGWLVDVLRGAQKERKRRIDEQFPNYRVYGKEELISGSWYENPDPDFNNDMRLPSFTKAWLYIKRCSKVFDYTDFPSASYSS